ncbi:pantothenate transporter, putative [Talaromyces stipitatus ATCC 10500]|uniref:Pantothenate transporter, putative n=1 Tax=Talaromyces stipitatus (strain ATCC 10500 / CBS 375.48 / QM 6759 / NRRL 1006) TaxID=441959 RepID=B8M0K3_TALSN|nr:pantothenate transporter, putative [Talaromyces stipitatus ATCC 10500]EED21300.1 pantothenate transporter, putative [Talaromyces stipitatus ATCC 10500]
MPLPQTEPCLEGGTTANDEARIRRIVRKVDWRLIPILFFTYMLNFMDKTILSSASVFGLIDDTHLVGQQYSWVSSIFYFGYFFWEYPTNVLIARLPVAKYLAFTTFLWGIVVAVTAACVNYGGLLAVRFLLGVAEATITPAFMFITTTWYTRDEIPVRTGIWFAGNSIGGLVASLLAYGVGHIHHPLHPWMWMFIILGVLTFLWGFVLLAFLPDSISNARFLNEDEKEIMTKRAIIKGTGRTEQVSWRWDQTVECLMDPKSWIIFCITILTQIPNGGTQNFANLVIKSFGFTSLESTLINIPASVVSALSISVTGWLAGRYSRLNNILIICVVALAVTGSAIIYSRRHIPHKGAPLFGFFLIETGPAILPLVMSLVQANYKGVTKKQTMTAMMFIAYCAGNIAGPQFFRTKEAPVYNTAFKAILICYVLAAALAAALRVYLSWLNKKRDREEGVVSGAETGDEPVKVPGKDVDAMVMDITLQAEDYDDVTDWKTVGFRYRL